MKEQQIFLLGTVHISNKSGRKIKLVTEKNKFDCFLVEGIDTRRQFTSENFLKEPYFMVFFYFYLLFLKHFGAKEPILLKEIARKKKIPIHSVDKELNQLIMEGHRWYNNWIIFPALFIITNLLFIKYLIMWGYLFLIITIPCSLFFYFGYFVIIQLNRAREGNFLYKTNEIMEKKKYERALLVLGKLHIKHIYKRLTQLDKFKIEIL